MAFLRTLAAAFRFLTRLPVPGAPLEGAALGRALAFFPLPGLALGAIAAAAARLLSPRLPPGVLAALLVALLAWLTGGLHLDGLADVADGLGGGHGDRARTLAIMRDSRVGALGATAVAVLLLVKVSALQALLGAAATGRLGRAGGPATWALLCAPAVARFAAVPLVVLVPYARPEGLGRAFHEGGGPRELVVALALTALALVGFGVRVLLPSAAALAAAAVLALAVHRRLGGLTGDAYGAAIELAEAGFLVAATAG